MTNPLTNLVFHPDGDAEVHIGKIMAIHFIMANPVTNYSLKEAKAMVENMKQDSNEHFIVPAAWIFKNVVHTKDNLIFL